jgi:hypothetical protein
MMREESSVEPSRDRLMYLTASCEEVTRIDLVALDYEAMTMKHYGEAEVSLKPVVSSFADAPWSTSQSAQPIALRK